MQRNVLILLLSGLASASAFSVAPRVGRSPFGARTRSCSTNGELTMAQSSLGHRAAGNTAGLRFRAARDLADFVTKQGAVSPLALMGNKATPQQAENGLKNTMLRMAQEEDLSLLAVSESLQAFRSFDLSSSSSKVRTADRLW